MDIVQKVSIFCFADKGGQPNFANSFWQTIWEQKVKLQTTITCKNKKNTSFHSSIEQTFDSELDVPLGLLQRSNVGLLVGKPHCTKLFQLRSVHFAGISCRRCNEKRRRTSLLTRLISRRKSTSIHCLHHLLHLLHHCWVVHQLKRLLYRLRRHVSKHWIGTNHRLHHLRVAHHRLYHFHDHWVLHHCHCVVG